MTPTEEKIAIIITFGLLAFDLIGIILIGIIIPLCGTLYDKIQYWRLKRFMNKIYERKSKKLTIEEQYREMVRAYE